MWRQKKKLASQEVNLVSFDWSWFSLSKNADHHPPQKKRTVQLGDAFEDTAFKPGFVIVKF
jgi:hypothetical protein